jgi:phospholipid-translocating ATPase
VLAAGSAVGFVIYTGAETRAVMNTSHPGTKVGLLDLEINKLAKVRTHGLLGFGEMLMT